MTDAVVLTQRLVVFDLLSSPTEKRSGSLLEEALCGTGDVEIRGRVTTAGGQTLRTEALRDSK